MSADRKYRRGMTQPAGKVELSHETRALVAQVLHAHDDGDITIDEFLVIGRRLAEHSTRLTEAQRMEVAGMVIAHTLGGRYVGWGSQ